MLIGSVCVYAIQCNKTPFEFFQITKSSICDIRCAVYTVRKILKPIKMTSDRRRLDGWTNEDVSSRDKHDPRMIETHMNSRNVNKKRPMATTRRQADNDTRGEFRNKKEDMDRRRGRRNSDDYEYKWKLDEQHTEKNNKARHTYKGDSSIEGIDIEDRHERYDSGSVTKLPEISQSPSLVSNRSNGTTKSSKLEAKSVRNIMSLI